MQLETGYRFCLAPRFVIPLDWSQRLTVNTGVIRDAEGRLTPEPTWRVPTDAELGQLVVPEEAVQTPAADQPSATAWESHVCLFSIPEHLRVKWWELAAEQVAESADGPAGRMDDFAQGLAEFARFKQIPLPAESTFEMTLAPPPTERSDRPQLDFGQGDGTAPVQSPAIAQINLGEERTALVFLNLRPARLAELPGSPAAARPAANDAAHQFLSQFPQYPLVRLVLEPGEGAWLPDNGVLCADDVEGKAEIDVRLSIRPADASSQAHAGCQS
jgi:hypothetical protein